MSNTFLYFAYGSNMLAKRIHINNPTAVRKGIGFIQNFRLDFATFSKRWQGAAATLVEAKDSSVWGTIWEINNSSLAALDEQEGVCDKIYYPMTVEVKTPDNDSMNCRVYRQCTDPEYIKPELWPHERKPSPLYLGIIIEGAKESNLPAEYIKYLESLPNNGYSGEYNINLSLKEV